MRCMSCRRELGLPTGKRARGLASLATGSWLDMEPISGVFLALGILLACNGQQLGVQGKGAVPEGCKRQE
jgi:hypothetical protein